MTLPLTGIKVLDITANMSGPFGTMILGDQGADVIKLEPPGGDPIRNLGTGTDGLTAYYANLNRSKRSVVLDLELAESRPVFERLLDWADVVVHNYRPAAAKSLRIDADSVRATRPNLIHVTIVGFGSTGPKAGHPAYDHVIQAMSGSAIASATRARASRRWSATASPTSSPVGRWRRPCAPRSSAAPRPAKDAASRCACSTSTSRRSGPTG